MPVDTPMVIRPGVTHREADFHGNASQLAVPPDDEERAAKGDLAQEVPELGRGLTKSGLSHAGAPFANLRRR
jgi:hypothetical protein